MASESSENGKSTTMTVRLTPETSRNLEALARNTDHSKSYLAGEAIALFVDVNAWQVARIKQALDDAQSGESAAVWKIRSACREINLNTALTEILRKDRPLYVTARADKARWFLLSKWKARSEIAHRAHRIFDYQLCNGNVYF
jgi:predicted transcriptional regulator